MIPSKRVIVGMSGGVDSSVAALLLKEQGYDVQGLFMKNWQEDDTAEYCSASVDVADARAVCETLAIPLHTVNFSVEYWNNVFQHFIAEYRAGRTPNPDILCNKEIKFKAFLDHAKELGADYIATGHYARIQSHNNEYFLLKGLDDTKDQSYFLYTLGQHALKHSLFPIGEFDKTEIRKIAADNKLITADKKDSTGICFIGERKFKTFLSQYLPAQPGNIETLAGELVGQHDGLMYYTLGQRQGLGIGGRSSAIEAPWYVLEKDLARNVLVVGQERDHPKLLSTALNCKQLHWVAEQAPTQAFECTAKTRYRQKDQACRVVQLSDDHYSVTFTEPQWAVTPGQSVVFYQGERCLGGGVIEG